MATLNKPVA